MGGESCAKLFSPFVTFAWGLIYILVHCAGMLLLLSAGLYYPDKTWSFKRFGALAVLPLLFFLRVYSSPFLFWVTCSFFPLSPFQSGTLLYPPNPISFLALSPLSTSPLYLSLVIIECSHRIWVK